MLIVLHCSDSETIFSKDTTNKMLNLNSSTVLVLTETSKRVPNVSVTTMHSSILNNAVNSVSIVTILIGIGAAILIVLITIVVLTLVFLYIRKSTQSKPKSDYDDQYSTLCRGDTQQLEPQSLQAPTDLYNQIQLSPSTGQTEVISKNEPENTNSRLPHLNNPSPNIDIEVPIVKEQSTVSTSEQPTYAVVKKKQKRSKLMKGKISGQNQNNAVEKSGEKVPQCSFTAATTDKTDIKQEDQIKQGEAVPTSLQTVESPEALYTAIKKKPKDNATETHIIEDLYTAVMKKPKDDPTESDTEAAPPLPHIWLKSCTQLFKKSQKLVPVKWRMKRKPLQYLHTQWKTGTKQNLFCESDH